MSRYLELKKVGVWEIGPADLPRRKIADLSYRDELFQIVRSRSPQENELMTYEVLKEIASLVDKVESAKDGETLVLSESEWEIAVDKMKKSDFLRYSRELLEFCCALEQAPAQEPRRIEMVLTEQVELADGVRRG